MNAIVSMAGFFNPANIGMPELVIVLAIVLVIFGPKKLPGLGKAMGKSIREFKDGIKGLGNVMQEEVEAEEEDHSPKGDLDPKPVAQSTTEETPEATPAHEPAKEPAQ